jgi:hypothetical protein
MGLARTMTRSCNLGQIGAGVDDSQKGRTRIVGTISRLGYKAKKAGGTSVKLLATPPTHHSSVPEEGRVKGREMRPESAGV